MNAGDNMKKYYYPEDRIAVVSMGGVFPDAHDLQEFWQNILMRKVSIKELPESILNTKVYYRPEYFKQINKHDKSYTRMGAIIDLDPVLAVAKKFRIPPAVAEYMDPNQHGAIYCVDQALQALKGKGLPKERTAVILSGGNPAELNERAVERNFFALLEEHLRNNQLLLEKLNNEELQGLLGEITEAALKETLPFTEDTTTGFLPNLVPGRVSNVFDFQGPSYLVDAACASALASTIIGVRGLLNKEYDAAVVGGIDFGLNATRLAVFSAINALSPDGSFPFDLKANGFVMGQGAGALVLKRLEDALRDQNEIIALISGYGQGSDGKGKYIAAPNEKGQARVIQGACQMAGYPVDTIELIEAHGTGTSVGDVVEISALKKAFSALHVTKKNHCGIGSVKSNIGHLKAAAGAPGLIKAALALYHRTLPPTANVRQINPKLQLENSPFYILTQKKAWRERQEHPRRANVSAFGFGGANYHVAMEEYRPEFYKKVYTVPAISESNSAFASNLQNSGRVVFFSGKDLAEITDLYNSFQVGAEREQPSFTGHVFLHNAKVSAEKNVRLALYASSYEELVKKWNIFQEQVSSGRLGEKETLNFQGIYYGEGPVVTAAETALLFPGQAAQYPNMCEELPAIFPVVRSFYSQVDALWQAYYGYTISPLIFGRDEAVIDQKLQETKNTHPAMFMSSAGIFKLFSESGLRADYFIGHSLGEMIALYAGGMVDLPSAIRLIGARGLAFDRIPVDARGKLMSINAGEEEVKEILSDLGLEIFVANLNAPAQTVVGGADGEIERLASCLGEKKARYKILSVSHAFHTPLITDAAEAFFKNIVNLQFVSSGVKIMANHLQAAYPKTQKGLKKMPILLKEQMISSVRFAETIRLLYKKGVRAFVEIGPATVLSNLVRQILPDQAIETITTCPKGRNAAESYYRACGELFSLGVSLCMAPSQADMAVPTVTNHEDKQGITGEKSLQAKSGENFLQQENLVYSGVSIGLPGSFKKVFDDRNWEDIFAGHNFIEMLTKEDLAKMLDLNITRLVKDKEKPVFKHLSSVNELIRLAGKLGELKMIEDYLVDEEILQQMTSSVCAGVAAGYEALKDAGIPLVREWITTASGAKIPGRLLLPAEMREDTGVIFANCFAMVEPFIREVSAYVASRYGSRTKRELRGFYESLILRLSDEEAKKALTDWFTLNYSRLRLGEIEVYEFNKDFITQYTSLANNRLAQLIGASGPNFHLNAACSSTAYAVTIAESLIRTGHAARVIVIGAENSTGEQTLPWIGASFLTSGAATTSADLYTAAVPFDKRRNGMILGAGAVGIVLEKETDLEARGMKGICRLLGSHGFNMAGHQSRIDSGKFSHELERFIVKMERTYGIRRKDLARKTVYFSHETYTPKRGGCSQTEKVALETVFGEDYREILVTNTKGMTGHTIGASIEEAVAAKALQFQKTPPIVNCKEPDPELEGLRLSQGGSHSFEYVLRMVAGFGGQGNYILTQKVASADARVVDSAQYQSWLTRIASSPKARLTQVGRILMVLGDEVEGETGSEPGVSLEDVNKAKSGDFHSDPVSAKDREESINTRPERESITDQVLEIYAQVTKYPKEMLDLRMEMEADLGIDTVKQATIFALVAEKFRLEQETEIELSNYSTIGDVVALVSANAGVYPNQSEAAATANPAHKEPAQDREGVTGQEIEQGVIRVISEVTKYPVEMLDLEMEMEADLGIDTVKQATILSQLTEEYGLAGDAPQISTLPTIGHIVALIKQSINTEPLKERSGTKERGAPALSVQSNQEPYSAVIKPGAAEETKPVGNGSQHTEANKEAVLEVIAEITKYPVEMLDLEMEMEADLGIDTVKQATIFSILGERFGVGQDEGVGISEYKTIGAVVEFAQKLKSSGAPPASATFSAGFALDTPKDRILESRLISDDEVQIDLCYQRPVAVEAVLPPKEISLKEKNVLVIGNHSKAVNKVAAFLEVEAKQVETIVLSDPLLPEEIFVQLEQIAKEPLEALIDIGDLGCPPDQGELSPAEEERLLRLNSEARFVFYQAFQSKLGRKLRIVCTVSLDGQMGYAQSSVKLINVYSRALCGFYKGLRKEWKDATVKIVDLDLSTLRKLDGKAAAKIREEVETGGEDFEIAYSGETRRVIKLMDLDQAEMKETELPETPHILITGGANGITAEVAFGLAARIKGNYTLLGRTVLPENIQELSAMDEARLEKLRGEIQVRLKATKKRVTPVLAQEEFERITKAISAYNTIERIKNTGSKVQYFACDVTDRPKLQTVIKQAVKDFGPVVGLIHGAGLEKSHLLADKSVDEFKKVFSVKALGLCQVIRALDPDYLRVVVGFSSISGRFGNEAQLDYCAANSFLGGYIRMLKNQYPHLHGVSIDWSGWKDLGMAWRNEFVKLHGEESGVHLIEPARGVQACVKVFTHGISDSELVISRGLKGFSPPYVFLDHLTDTPMIDWVTRKNGTIERVCKILSVKKDPIIDHHRLGNTPLVPAVALMEIGAEYHSLLFSRQARYIFKDLSIMHPLKLFGDKAQELSVEAISEPDPNHLELEFKSCFISKIGVPKMTTHCRYTVGREPGAAEEMLKYTDLRQEKLTEMPFQESENNPRWQFKNNLNFGPLFIDEYGSAHNHFRYNENGLVYYYHVPSEQLENKEYHLEQLLINPCALDTLFQAAAVHALTQHNRIHLPVAVGEVGILQAPRQRECLQIIAHLNRYEEEVGFYDVIMFNTKNELCYYMKNVAVRRINL